MLSVLKKQQQVLGVLMWGLQGEGHPSQWEKKGCL